MNVEEHSTSPVIDRHDDDIDHNDDLVALAEGSRRPFDPELALFIDDSPASQQARELLEDAGEEFRTLRLTGPRIPAAVFGGIVAERLSGVEALLRGLRAFDATLLKGVVRE